MVSSRSKARFSVATNRASMMLPKCDIGLRTLLICTIAPEIPVAMQA